MERLTGKIPYGSEDEEEGEGEDGSRQSKDIVEKCGHMDPLEVDESEGPKNDEDNGDQIGLILR